MNRLAAIAAALSVVTATVASAVVAPAASAGPPQWTIQTTTNPTASDGLQAVSCPSASACLAVGATGSHPTAAIAESWNGTSWTTTTPSAAPSKVASSSLQAVSCTSATACMAVGFWDDGSGAQHILAESWNGTGWTVYFVPDPVGSQFPALTGVSCTSATYCEAVGSYFDPATQTNGDLAEVWDGQGWAIQPTHAAFSKMDFELASVSCSSSSSCLAVGHYVSLFGSAAHFATWAERWDGTSWSGTFPDVEGTLSNLTGVSCATATADCTTVGEYQDASGTEFPLAERWNGSSWSLQFPAASAVVTGMRLSAVSCPAVTACMAVGIAHVPAISPGTWVTVAESWNGSTWTLDNTPNPLGAVMAGLGGVSCPAALVCAGVGAWTSVAAHRPPTATLAERYA